MLPQKARWGLLPRQQTTRCLQKNTEAGGIVTGTGHNSITYAPDGKTMLCVYHGRTSKTGDERVVFIDKMKVTNGVLTVEGPNPPERNNKQLQAIRYWQILLYFSMRVNIICTEPLAKIQITVSRLIVLLIKKYGKMKGMYCAKGESYGDKGFWAPQIFKHQWQILHGLYRQ